MNISLKEIVEGVLNSQQPAKYGDEIPALLTFLADQECDPVLDWIKSNVRIDMEEGEGQPDIFWR